jgi:hypothetical protein
MLVYMTYQCMRPLGWNLLLPRQYYALLHWKSDIPFFSITIDFWAIYAGQHKSRATTMLTAARESITSAIAVILCIGHRMLDNDLDLPPIFLRGLFSFYQSSNIDMNLLFKLYQRLKSPEPDCWSNVAVCYMTENKEVQSRQSVQYMLE